VTFNISTVYVRMHGRQMTVTPRADDRLIIWEIWKRLSTFHYALRHPWCTTLHSVERQTTHLITYYTQNLFCINEWLFRCDRRYDTIR